MLSHQQEFKYRNTSLIVIYIKHLCTSSEMEGYFEDRSEKWQSSSNGKLFYEWLELWRDTQNAFSDSVAEIDTFNYLADDLNADEPFGLDIGISEDIEIPVRDAHDL